MSNAAPFWALEREFVHAPAKSVELIVAGGSSHRSHDLVSQTYHSVYQGF